jgi:hypothetical protein
MMNLSFLDRLTTTCEFLDHFIEVLSKFVFEKLENCRTFFIGNLTHN